VGRCWEGRDEIRSIRLCIDFGDFWFPAFRYDVDVVILSVRRFVPRLSLLALSNHTCLVHRLYFSICRLRFQFWIPRCILVPERIGSMPSEPTH